MQIKLRCYDLGVQLYRESKQVKLPAFLKDQLQRAASSVALNIAEGYGKRTEKDRMKYFTIALGSTREVQAIADLEPKAMETLAKILDQLGGSLYRLTHSG